jgi:hypothetical protein
MHYGKIKTKTVNKVVSMRAVKEIYWCSSIGSHAAASVSVMAPSPLSTVEDFGIVDILRQKLLATNNNYSSSPAFSSSWLFNLFLYFCFAIFEAKTDASVSLPLAAAAVAACRAELRLETPSTATGAIDYNQRQS